MNLALTDRSTEATAAPRTRASRSFACAAAALAALALAGPACREHVRYEPAVEVHVVPPAPLVHVHNAGARAVSALRAKACGAPDADFRPLPGSEIAPGSTVSIVIDQLPDCVDLEATNLRGELVGRQNGLRMVPGGTWTIQ
jgi:hypothetical protein